MISKYGIPLVLIGIGLFLLSLLAAKYMRHPFWTVLSIVLGILMVFNIYFFRDPERKIPQDANAILSPADGKVVMITEMEEPQFFQTRVKRISIFLSVFNVHVNRVPVSGEVSYYNYNKGKFLAAFNDKASLDNEQTAIGITRPDGKKVMFTQIAGLIARRIVCELREGDKVEAGQRMGLIRYGSRVDVYFPSDSVDVKVQIGDKVTGGETILGVFR
ncbi:MAG: hypothetical protein Kow0037_01450 [Calditrichia bacterium]